MLRVNRPCLMGSLNSSSCKTRTRSLPMPHHARNCGLLLTPFGTSYAPIHECFPWWRRVHCEPRRRWPFWIVFWRPSSVHRSPEFRPSIRYSVLLATLLVTPYSVQGYRLWLAWSQGQTARQYGSNFQQSATRRSTRCCQPLRSGSLTTSLTSDCRRCSKVCLNERKVTSHGENNRETLQGYKRRGDARCQRDRSGANTAVPQRSGSNTSELGENHAQTRRVVSVGHLRFSQSWQSHYLTPQFL